MQSEDFEEEILSSGKGSPYMGIVLGTKLKTKVKEIAKKDNLSMSAVVRILLREALAQREVTSSSIKL